MNPDTNPPRYLKWRYPLVAFCGPMGCGKSTAASLLPGHPMRYSFAGPLKSMLASLGLTHAQLNDPLLKNERIPWLGVTPRRLMQTLGTDWGRNTIDQDIWVKAATPVLTSLLQYQNVVIDDLRFDNEARLVRELGGVTIEIERTGREYSGAHGSEVGIDLFLVHDTVNNDGDVNRLEERLLARLTDLVMEP